MSFLRRISTRSLIVLVVAVCAVAVGGAAIAVAAGGGGPTPAPKPLDQAIQDALSATPPDGLRADVTFTNNLFPSGALLGQVSSALMTGASGRMWVTGDGHGRIELQSDAGDVQVVWDPTTVSVYDASSNTVYRATLPSDNASSTSPGTPPTLADIDAFLTKLADHWAIAGPDPTNVGGRPAYNVSLSPKHDGGLLGSVEVAWDAATGVPLSVGIAAQGSDKPVLGLALSNVSYGNVSSGDSVQPPSGAKVVDLGTLGQPAQSGGATTAVTGLAAVQSAADFPVVVPDTLVGLPLRDVRLVGGDTAIAFYGEGLGGIVLVERKADTSGNQSGMMSALPTVSLDGLTAHELSTQLGTVLAWQSGGTSFVLAGSQPAAAAEAAARAVK